MQSSNALVGVDASKVVDNCKLSIGNSPFICVVCNPNYFLLNGICLTDT